MRKYIQFFVITVLFSIGFSVAKSQLPEDIIINQPQPIVKCYDTQDEYLDLLVNVNSNLYDYCVQWYKENNNCTYGVVYFAFGQTHQEAVDKAIAQKNSWGGSNVSYDIIENKYW